MANKYLLGSKILKAKYCLSKSLSEAKFRMGNSWFWKGFVEATYFINGHVGRILGNVVWRCNWIPYKGGLRAPFFRYF